MSAMSDEEFEEFLNMPVRIRFWVCPVTEHRDRRDDQGMPVVTVEWDENGIARCTAPDCQHTNAPHVHTEACLCVMVPMEVEGASECHYCGVHGAYGKPCGDRCDVARAEVVARG